MAHHRRRFPALLMPALAVLTWLVTFPGHATASEVERPRASTPGPAIRVNVVLEPWRQATISSQVAARVLRVHQHMGAVCKQGELLIELDDRVYAAREARARAQLAAATAALASARELHDRQTRVRRAQAILAAAQAHSKATANLYQRKQASAQELAAAQRDEEVARADLELARARTALDLAAAQKDYAAAKAGLELTRIELAACRIVAPYAGKLVRVIHQERERVEPGTPLLQYLDDSKLLARFIIPTAAAAAIEQGRVLSVRLENGQHVRAGVQRLSPALDAASHTLEVVAVIDNRRGALRAGLNGSVTIGGGHER